MENLVDLIRVKSRFQPFRFDFEQVSAETSDPEPPQLGGRPQKKGSRIQSVRSTIYSTCDKGPLNRSIPRFNMFFVLTRAMWGPHTIFIFLDLGGPCKFSKNSSRKTSRQTFTSIPRAPHPQVKGAKISLKNVFSSHSSKMLE